MTFSMEKKGWEGSSYKEFFTTMSEKFKKETADYLLFMEQRHKIATLDYIATLEHDNKMKESTITQLKKELKQLKGE